MHHNTIRQQSMRNNVDNDLLIKAKSVVLQEESQGENISGLSSFEMINLSTNKAYIYKVRGNNPKQYRLKNSFCIIEPTKSIFVHVRLIEMSQYSPKDLFQIKFFCLENELRSHEETPQTLWNSLELLGSIFQEKILQVILAEQQQPIQIQSENRIPTDVSIKLQSSKQRSSILTPTNKLLTGTSPTSRIPSKFFLQDQNTPTSSRSTSHAILTPKVQSAKSKMSSTQQSFFKSQQSGRSLSSREIIGSRSNSVTPSSERFISRGLIRQNSFQSKSSSQLEIKDLYEKLVVQVDEQDKQLFVLTKQRKALESQWNALNRQQEQAKNEEASGTKSRNLTSINFSSAAVIALISLLIGIYLGN